MRAYAEIGPGGRILRSGLASAAVFDALEPAFGGEIVEAPRVLLDLSEIWQDGAPVARPATPAWPVTATADVEVSVAGYPAGTVAEVLWGGAVVATVPETAGVIAVTFGDPGEWQVRIVPPFPWLPATAAVTVSP